MINSVFIYFLNNLGQLSPRYYKSTKLHVYIEDKAVLQKFCIQFDFKNIQPWNLPKFLDNKITWFSIQTSHHITISLDIHQIHMIYKLDTQWTPTSFVQGFLTGFSGGFPFLWASGEVPPLPHSAVLLWQDGPVHLALSLAVHLSVTLWGGRAGVGGAETRVPLM